jgi:hypothetical protein
MDILNIADEPVFDERIVKYEMHTYNPYANTTLGYSDEIRYNNRICTRCRVRVFYILKENLLRILPVRVEITRAYWEIIVSLSCLMNCDTNSMELKSIATETLE